MIARADAKQRRSRFLKACAGKPVLGCLLPLHLRLYGRQGGLYSAPTLALDLSGEQGYAAGSCNAEELASFLLFAGCSELISDGICPAGWRTGEPITVYTLTEPARLQAAPLPAGVTLNPQPGIRTAAALLYPSDPAKQNDFYADACVRRNHGAGRLWSLERAGETLAVLRAALCAGQAYMDCGFVRADVRGTGLGGSLITAAAQTLAAEGYAVTFACAPERTRFYDRLGFTRCGTLQRCCDPYA